MMHYIIQENVFKDIHYDLLEEALNRLNLSYTTVRVFPHSDKIVDVDLIPVDFDVDELPELSLSGKVFVFGGIKLARLAAQRNWNPGSMMNANHDHQVYSLHYGDNMLNADALICKLTDEFTWNIFEQKFIKPTFDSKAFKAELFTEEGWRMSVENFLYNHKSEILNENTMIQVSSPKNIQKEIRFWVVGGKIITGSQYKIGDNVIYDDVFEESAQEFAQSMVDKFQLADAFVIDVCLSDGQWKVIECNCLNCAGFYKANLPKLICELEYFF